MYDLKDSLGGGYAGLYGEVVTEDCYRLKQMKFVPEVVFDIGGNIGIFARYAAALFPQAKIISVEPNPQNCADFKRFTDSANILLLEAALGRGSVFQGKGAANGAHESYLSSGLGYRGEELEQCTAHQQVPVLTFMLNEIFTPAHARKKTLMKIDCEGAENIIWQHAPSMQVLRQIDYLVMELHMYALTARDQQEVVSVTAAALESLEATHRCEREGVYFWATKK